MLGHGYFTNLANMCWQGSKDDQLPLYERTYRGFLAFVFQIMGLMIPVYPISVILFIFNPHDYSHPSNDFFNNVFGIGSGIAVFYCMGMSWFLFLKKRMKPKSDFEKWNEHLRVEELRHTVRTTGHPFVSDMKTGSDRASALMGSFIIALVGIYILLEVLHTPLTIDIIIGLAVVIAIGYFFFRRWWNSRIRVKFNK